ncbi:MAG: ribosome biogenesis GTP-binding protein YihA/YsxC [Lachnospiraceae bacterium]|nr:ribosome biogenesis GTP-binding protein YihA/YsxC [Lachnospiraceae bacterium]
MVIKSVNLETVVGPTSKFVQNDKIEIAFAGRSNVGKSSLINRLMNRKSYARVSSKPGKTQTINYYNINDECYFVDLPGYGYAKAQEKKVKEWGQMIENYFKKSKALRLIILLVDIRHKPNANDIQMYDWCLAYGYNPIIIATKLDKVKKSERKKLVKDIRLTLGLSEESPIIPYSSLTGEGMETIHEYLDFVLENFADDIK